MEYLVNCNIIMDIDCIDSIIGGYGYDCGYKYTDNRGGGTQFEMLISNKDKEGGSDKRYKLIFGNVWDMRYSTEFANVNRLFDAPEARSKELVDSRVLIVENSEYIKFFDTETVGVIGTDRLKHYHVFDRFDSVFDILAFEEPQLVELE